MGGQAHELVENFDLLTDLRTATPNPQCFDQPLARRHSDLPCHVDLPPPDNPTGGKSREGTGQHEEQI